MLNTLLEVTKEIRAKYATATMTSKHQVQRHGKNIEECLYAHSINGVGCAIGCLVTSDEAELLDGNGRGTDISSVLEDPERAPILHKYISNGIRTEELIELQIMHDEAANAEAFRTALDRLITDLEAQPC